MHRQNLTFFHHGSETTLWPDDIVTLERQGGTLRILRGEDPLHIEGSKGVDQKGDYQAFEERVTVGGAAQFIKEFAILFGAEYRNAYEDGSRSSWCIVSTAEMGPVSRQRESRPPSRSHQEVESHAQGDNHQAAELRRRIGRG